MKVLILNTQDSGGGAAMAARRLFQAITAENVDVHLGLQKKTAGSDAIACYSGPVAQRLRPKLDSLYSKIHKPRHIFSTARVPFSTLLDIIEEVDPDIVNLHWVNGGFLNIRDLAKIHKPIVWTLHDSWVFTGGCHVPLECKNYENICGSCPALNSTKYNDLSHSNYLLKKSEYAKKDFAYITPSRWLGLAAQSSSLLRSRRGYTIPNALDTSLYKRGDSLEARKSLGLPLNKKILGFGAMGAFEDLVKGGDLLLQALPKLDPSVHLCFFGSRSHPPGIAQNNCAVLGEITDEKKMVDVLNALDTLVVPSRSENFPYMILEALSTGLPVTAFAVGGIPEIIQHQVNGYLAKPFDINDLVAGINHCLSLGRVEFENHEYSERTVALKYIQAFQSLLKNQS